MASVGATNVTSIAHAVFGAIGISEEHDLQIHTRNLHAWRIADGSESYWTEQLGAAALRSDAAAAGILPFPGRYR
jgi:acyl-CoA dehydrogenase